MEARDLQQAALEHAILDLVKRPGYRPVKPRFIARQLQVPKDRLPEVKKAIKRLVREGRLTYEARHLVKPSGGSKPTGSRVVGVFRRAQGGFGFVRPTETAAGGADAPDIYIAAPDTGDASTGDMVLVQLAGRSGRAHLGPQGEIVEVLKRETYDFVGTYFESAGGAYVQVDGTVFSQPVYVGDPGVKGARPDDKVVVEMVRFPSHVRDGEGVIIEVLGPCGKPGVDTLSIMREFHLPEQFAADALEEARQAAEAFQEAVPAGRLDLTGQTIITIDPADARDFDDAISLEQLDGGCWRLGVHIADVSHFFRPKTALDREALQRATSVYLPDRVIPMLPEILSNGLASLQPGKIRYAKTVFMEFTPDGLCTDTQLHNSAISSSKRLTYEQVDEFLQAHAAAAGPGRETLAPQDRRDVLQSGRKDQHPRDLEFCRRKLGIKVGDLLGRMHQLAMILRRRRLRRGALELSMPEVKVELDRSGRVAGAYVVENTESHQIIEEFMLAANEAVAVMLRDKGFQFLRRVHQSPSPRKLQLLTEFAKELGLKTESLQSRFALQKLLQQVAGRPEQHAVNYAVLRSLQRAVYSPAEEGHYALASDCYCHFTSPIRRYPDLTVHRLVQAVLEGGKPHGDFDELVVLGQHCSDQEQRAESAERELTKLKLLAYLSQRIGQQMDCIITGVESFGLFAQGIELPAEGMIPVASLTDDYYRFDRSSHTLVGRRAENSYRLGDVLRVSVARVDVERRELDFHLVQHKGRPAVASAETRRPKKAGRKMKRTEGKNARKQTRKRR